VCYAPRMPSERKVIALRLEDDLHQELAVIAQREVRPLANLVVVLVRAGLRDYRERHAQPATAEA